jgi:hypothetical protein
MWNEVKNNVSQDKSWLKSVGLYDPHIKLIKGVRSYYANKYCKSKGVPDSIYSSIIIW